MRNNRKLRSLLINPDFQGKFLAIFTIFGFFQAFVNYYAVHFSFKQIELAASSAHMPAASQLFENIQLQKFYVTTFIGIAFALSFFAFVFVGARLTHQAAGALYRFKDEFKKMKDNKALHNISLRKDDFFRDVEEAFNEMVNEVADKPSSSDKQ